MILIAIPLTGLLGLLVTLLIGLVIIGLLFWCVNRLSGAFGIPEPIRSVIIVALVIITVVALLYYLAGYLPR